MKIVKRIKKEMKKQGINQSELARRIGLTEAGVSYLMNTTRMPSIKTLLNMSKALDVNPDYLLGLSDEPIRGLFQKKKISEGNKKAKEKKPEKRLKKRPVVITKPKIKKSKVEPVVVPF